MSKQFGGKPTPEDLERYERSPQWNDGSFMNTEPTDLGMNFWKIPGVIYKQIKGHKGSIPLQFIPVAPFSREHFLAEDTQPKFIWFGHSALLMRINGKTLLIDPMLGPDASPIAPFKTRRFSENTLDLIDEFPPIDLVLITHDHYDHLDMASIEKLRYKAKHFFVALGVKRHLTSWDVPGRFITEFDWWDTHKFEGIDIHFTPTRHFSGRGLKDRAKSLWGGWVFKTENHSIWFSGDGGYGPHFKEIGSRLGPFDLGFMECGQYNDDWPLIHMFPEEAVTAAKDAGVRIGMPVHWAGFSLSYQHSWKDPVKHFLHHAEMFALPATAPALGQLFRLDEIHLDPWWK